MGEQAALESGVYESRRRRGAGVLVNHSAKMTGWDSVGEMRGEGMQAGADWGRTR